MSLANGVVGVLHAAALGIHAIGRGLADALDLDPKHAIKQAVAALDRADTRDMSRRLVEGFGVG